MPLLIAGGIIFADSNELTKASDVLVIDEDRPIGGADFRINLHERSHGQAPDGAEVRQPRSKACPLADPTQIDL